MKTNHNNVWITCRHCSNEFDSQLHGTVCPNCGNLKSITKTAGKIITIIVIIALILLAFSSCKTNKYAARQHKNRIAQEELQYTHSLSAHQDWTRSCRNWHNRPKGNWPFNFIKK